MMKPPTTDQIDAAMSRAAEAAREVTKYPDRLAEFPLASESCRYQDAGWWLIGWILVIGEPEEWDVLYDPETDEGRLRAKR